MFQLKIVVVALLLLCLILIGIGKCESKNAYKTVQTRSGRVRGIKKMTLLRQKTYYSFRGIPFARKPTGELRFKPPEPVDQWAETIDVFEYGAACTQFPLVYVDKNMETSEDCLFLNIFVPAETESTAKMAVIFYLYGGGFRAGSGDDILHGPDFLIENNVILVTVNYRVHIFGFLSLNTSEYSGNMGFKDQQLGLKWIHDNIEYFNGDKNQITIAGHSGGAMAANFHAFNDISNKLFKNIICWSGTAHVFNVFSSKNDYLDEMYKIAKKLSYPAENFQHIVEFLKAVPAEQLLNVTADVKRVTFAPPSYGPVIESMSQIHTVRRQDEENTGFKANTFGRDAIQPFLVETPDEMYNHSGRLNITSLFTFTNNEHIDFLRPEEVTPSNIDHFIDTMDLSIPFQGYDKPLNVAACPKLKNKIREFYFGNTNTSYDRMLGYAQLYSDTTLIYGIEKTVRVHANKSNGNTFYWRFAVDSIIKAPKNVQVPGAGHSDELCHIFRCKLIEPLYLSTINTSNTDTRSQISLQTIQNITKLVTNFAKYGTPVVNNDPVSDFRQTNGNIKYLDIRNDGVFPQQSLNEQSFDFWSNIFDEARKTCMVDAPTENLI